MARRTHALLLLICAIVTLQVACRADDQQEEPDRSLVRKEAVVPAGQVIDRDYFAYGQRVDIAGTVNGDVYAAGGDVIVNGTINGDLLAVGGTITVTGTIAHDARVAGGTVTVSGDIGSNLTVAGWTVLLTPQAVIRGRVVAAGNQLELASPVARDAKVAARDLDVASRIRGNVTAAGEVIRLTSRARVDGNLIYWSRTEASIDNQASVSGKLSRREIPWKLFPSPDDFIVAFAGLQVAVTLVNFVSTLCLGLLAIRYYPTTVQQALNHLTQRPMKSLGVGFLALVLLLILTVILAVTIVGFPLAVILLAWYLFMLYVCRIIIMTWIGLVLFEKFGKGDYPRSAFFVGLTLYSLLTFVPIVGELIALVVILFGLGTLFMAKRDVYRAANARALM